MYGSCDMDHDRQTFLSFWTIFCPFTPLTTPKIIIFKKWNIVGTPRLAGGGGLGPSKNWVTWGGGTKFFARKGDKPEKGGVDVEIGGVQLFLLLYSSVQSHLHFWISFSSTFSSKSCTKPGIISTFLIHSGSLQKMLTAIFNLVWNTQKSKWTRPTLNALPHYFSSHLWDKGVAFLLN